MINIINKYEENGLLITEYGKDGVITHIVKEPIKEDREENIEENNVPNLTTEERILNIEQTTAYTQLQVEYLTILAELQ